MTDSSHSNDKEILSDRRKRISKDDLYMFIALWMQKSPWAFQSTEDLNVVGSVFVLPNDRVLSADCTRTNDDHSVPVHGAIRPLIKYPGKVRDCNVYLTRKPCAHCVKMLVQARVSKVFYLPLPPEKPKPKDKEENKSVDALFQVSEVSKSFFIPEICQEHINQLKRKYQEQKIPFVINQKLLKNVEEENEWKNILNTELEWNEDWKNKIQEALEWQELGDDEIKNAINDKMNIAFKWFYLATSVVGETNEWDFISKGIKEPEEIDIFDRSVDTHFSRLAQMVSNRTDDPRTGVGCVITSGKKRKDVVSFGWNGFPSKALYGNHPRGSEKDDKGTKKKYTHIIYAAQNALLSRNQRSLDEECVVYMNVTPSDECMPLLYEVGVRNLVIPFFDEERKDQFEQKKKCFYELLKKEKINVFKAPAKPAPK